MLGVGAQYSGILKDQQVLEKLSQNWVIWAIISVGLAVAYSGYSVNYAFEGAYSDEIRYYFYEGGTWGNAWPVIFSEAPMVLIRTTLHGFLCAAITITMIAVLYRFTNDSPPVWESLAACSYGIYFFHEPFVVWTQYILLDSTLPALFKLLVAFGIGLGASWLLTAKVLRKLPVTKRVF